MATTSRGGFTYPTSTNLWQPDTDIATLASNADSKIGMTYLSTQTISWSGAATQSFDNTFNVLGDSFVDFRMIFKFTTITVPVTFTFIESVTGVPYTSATYKNAITTFSGVTPTLITNVVNATSIQLRGQSMVVDLLGVNDVTSTAFLPLPYATSSSSAGIILQQSGESSSTKFRGFRLTGTATGAGTVKIYGLG